MRILVFQHLPIEHPGTLLEFWRQRGDRWDVVELDEGETIPALEGYDLLVVMGGPMDVWQEQAHPWLIPEKAAIRGWVKDHGRPFLGICLGHQLLAEALGGSVGLMKRPEVGLANVRLTEAGAGDPLLQGFDRVVETFQWHGAEVTKLPAGAVVLAENDACPVQAFRWGPHAYGFQYHAEIVDSTVMDWQRIPEYMASLVAALGETRAHGLADEVSPRLPAFRSTAQRLDGNLARIIEGGHRPRESVEHQRRDELSVSRTR